MDLQIFLLEPLQGLPLGGSPKQKCARGIFPSCVILSEAKNLTAQTFYKQNVSCRRRVF